MTTENEILNSAEYLNWFNRKKRLCCAVCGSVSFILTPTGLPNTDVKEAVFMTCNNCGHKRLELV